jgi:hypothetical protein
MSGLSASTLHPWIFSHTIISARNGESESLRAASVMVPETGIIVCVEAVLIVKRWNHCLKSFSPRGAFWAQLHMQHCHLCTPAKFFYRDAHLIIYRIIFSFTRRG